MSKKAIGACNLHFATYTVAEDGSVTYNKPKRIIDAEEITPTDKFSEGSNYADNKQNIYISKITGADINIVLSSIDPEIEAILTGKSYDEGEIETTVDDKSSGVAILYQRNFDDGSYENIVYYNAKLRREDYGAKTEGENIDFTGVTILGQASPLPNGKIKYAIHSDKIGEDAGKKKKLDNFFKTVQFKDVADTTV
ncbi:MAG: phage tail protein [Clostridium sp.]|nr:phage tail protein [Clostridium sp.]